MRWRLLGPMQLLAGERAVDLGPGKQRCVLAALLLTPRRAVPVETLVDRVWGDAPPRSSNAVAPYAARLRRILEPVTGPGILRHCVGGYLIDCDPDLVDLHRARALIQQARAARDGGRDRQAADLLREALADWQPDALAGVPGAWAARVREALDRERLDAMAQRGQADLRLGRHDEVADELGPVAADHPAVEPLVAALMTALAGAGRPAQALECYARTREAIADQLGSEPSAELQALHLRILHQEPVLTGAGRTTPVVPAQLPADAAGFIGRRAQLAQLDRLVPGAAAWATPRPPADPTAGPVTVPIVAVSGPPGVGKSALAVHWAHRVRAAFPDGQLYLNLRGFDQAGSVMPVEDAVRNLLSALFPSRELPAGLDARVGLLRSLLAGRRALLLLDNARDAEHVRPLLPGTAGCVVIVTSRNQLTGLVAANGAQHVPVDLLPAGEARALLIERLGRRRVAAEPDVVDALVAATAGLPLALVTIAARAAIQADRPLGAIAAQLTGSPPGAADSRLDSLDGGDAVTDVRTVFSWSYRALSHGAARLFRLLGVHPGPDIGAAAAASLAGVTARRLRPLLAELIAAHLVVEHVPGRFLSHDLLRAYAAELAGATERRAALGRVLDHYLHTAVAGALLLDPHRDPPSLAAPRPGTTPEPLADEVAALAWFTAEHAVLMAAVRFAAGRGWEAYGWQLPWAMVDFLDRRGHWDDWITVDLVAVEAARRSGERAAEATGRRVLARGYVQVGRHRDAEPHYAEALRLYAGLGDAAGQAHTLFSVAWMYELEKRYDDAVRHLRRSLELYRAAGHRIGEARALNALGWHLGHLGRHELTLRHCHEALALHLELGDRYGEAAAWDSIGWAHHHLGQHDRAVDSYRRALDLYRQAGDLLNEADILEHLGDAYATAGARERARVAWREALDVLEALNHPGAAQVRAKLSDAEASVA
jgi:DNA-binding SARP family transcriptional activator/tetratricopeptide (TPR) repeat protein